MKAINIHPMLQRFLMILFFSALASGSVSGQEKSEKEYRARPDEIPSAALGYIESFPFGGKVRWYIEEGISAKSFEVKTIFNEKHYSIEFFDDGSLMDAEVEYEWAALPPEAVERMESRLAGDFGEYRVEKVQLQFSGNPAAVRERILNASSAASVTLKYEAVVVAMGSALRELYEYTFSEDGNLEKSEKIIQRGTENLEF